MKGNDLRELYVNYYVERGHRVAASASLMPENDTSVLYTSAGMQPLIPYLLGKKHPLGSRLTNTQLCVRTGDIEEVGDNSHLTVFEMLGNWSLGDYFKCEAIKMSYDFIVNVLKIPREKLAVTVYKGNEVLPKDKESERVWRDLGLNDSQIFFYDDSENWWGPIGKTGPCGPDSEMFYVHEYEKCSVNCGPACSCGKYVEIGNNVFMTYHKDKHGNFIELKKKNIDVGLGFERLLVLINNYNDVYETDLFRSIITKIEEISGKKYCDNKKSFRIISDHIRSSVFILADKNKIVPSNTEQGYILRRIIRRMVRTLLKIGISKNVFPVLVDEVVYVYNNENNKLDVKKSYIINELNKEFIRFNKVLIKGLKEAKIMLSELNEGQCLSGENSFKLYDTYGFPIELTIEIASELGIKVDRNGFNKCFQNHQKKSRASGVKKFKGGLSDNSSESIKLHTATHLLNGALRKVLGNSVYQKGSNINNERLRFDFSFDRKLTKDELLMVENIVNKAIAESIDIEKAEEKLKFALKKGAVGVYNSNEEDIVMTYRINNYSYEVCGGPHVKNTNELGRFKIIKEQSSSAGVRRIKAIIESK